jgi:hypothetical protein
MSPSLPSIRPFIAWALAAPAMLLALIAPALWNGFPIVYYDTGGYLMRPFDGTLAIGRSALYGGFLALGIPFDFWPNAIAQAALVAWLVALTFRVHGFGGKPSLVATIVGLALFTGLPWYVSQLIPDILVAAAVLALALLAFHDAQLRRWEKPLLGALIAFSIASHMAILALTLGLLAAFALMRLLASRLALPRMALAWPALAIAAGVLLAPFSNFLIAGRFAFTPGGTNFVFARLVQDGIVSRYLTDRCPDPSIALCAFRDDVATRSANDWLWDENSPLAKLGGFDAFAPTAQRIARDTLLAYPGLHVRTAAQAALGQFASFTTGDEIVPWTWHAKWVLERFAPATLPRFLASRQRTPIDLTPLNFIQVPIAALAIAALLVLATVARRRITAPAAALTLTVLVALVGNAAICGVLSNPQARYQGRLVWLAPLAVVIALSGWRHRLAPTSKAKPKAKKII